MSASQRPDAVNRLTLPRVEQFLATLTHRHSTDIDARIRDLLANDDQWQLVARLSTFDRAHHLRVHDVLATWGHSDSDLLRAALLHDIGKASEVNRVRLWHRVARVTGRRFSPQLWESISNRERRIGGGLYLAEHHARLGAVLARAAGASDRCCELIAMHEGVRPTGDAHLDALIAADEEV